MDSRIHAPVGFLACFIIYVITYYYYDNGNTWALVFSSIVGSTLPDWDKIFQLPHRNWFTHSFIVPLLCIIYMLGWDIARYYDVFFLILSLGFHLFFDLKISGKMGTYCIVKPGFVMRKTKAGKKKAGYDAMTARHTDAWLLANGSACFITCFLMYILF